MAKNQNTVESHAEDAGNSTNQTSTADQANQTTASTTTDENSGADNAGLSLKVREEDLNKREELLNEREEQLNKREEVLNERDYELRAELLTVQNKQFLLDQRSQSTLPQNDTVVSTDVVAVKDGKEQTFPLLAWENLGADKNGWTRKVIVPKEVQED